MTKRALKLKKMISGILLVSIAYVSASAQADVTYFDDQVKMDTFPNGELWPHMRFENKFNSPSPFSAVGRVFSKKMPLTGPTCSGTLIDNKFVITARHCVNQIRNAQGTAGFGFALDNGDKSLASEVIPFAPLAPNSNWNDGTDIENVKNDIAVLILAKPLGSPDDVLPILPHRPETALSRNSKLYLVGYPAFANNNPNLPSKYVSLPVCQVRKIEKGVIFSNCVPSSGISGGALILIDENKKSWLVGVLSSVLWSPETREYGSKIVSVNRPDILNFLENFKERPSK
jgi:V8-like Glu-specific endopeptidase